MQSRLLAITMQLAMRRQKSDVHMIYHHIRGSPMEMRLAFILLLLHCSHVLPMQTEDV